MKQIISSIQNRIKSIHSVRHVDIDLGQLSQEQPPVQFPCVLIAIDGADISHNLHDSMSVEGTISLTIATQHLVRSSGNARINAPQYNPYQMLDVITEVVESIDLFDCDGRTAPLSLSRIERSYVDRSNEVYTLTFDTSWQWRKSDNQDTAQVHSVRLSVNP